MLIWKTDHVFDVHLTSMDMGSRPLMESLACLPRA